MNTLTPDIALVIVIAVILGGAGLLLALIAQAGRLAARARRPRAGRRQQSAYDRDGVGLRRREPRAARDVPHDRVTLSESEHVRWMLTSALLELEDEARRAGQAGLADDSGETAP